MKNILFVVFCALAVMSCVREAPQKDTGDIYGVVTVKATAEPMRATGVELYKNTANNSLLLKTVTYDDGHYEFNDIVPGYYKLKITAEEYHDVEYDVVVEAGRTANVDMQLEKVNTGMTVHTLGTTVSGAHVVISGNCEYVGDAPDEVGFFMSQTSAPAKDGKKYPTTINDNEFFVMIDNLKTGDYYAQAYAKNGYGMELGGVKRFEIRGLPEVYTFYATNVSSGKATFNGKVEFPGDPTYTERGFLYSQSFTNPTIDDIGDDTKKIVVPGTSSDFSFNVELPNEGIYYVRAFAINATDVSYGLALNFDTEPYVYIDNMAVQTNDIGVGDTEMATSMCKKSNAGGFNDWRLPTIDELSIIYSNRNDIGKLLNSSNSYWSSTTDWDNHYKDDYFTYYFNFSHRAVETCPSDQQLYVRCVRTK